MRKRIITPVQQETALPGHLKTLSAILRCRTPESGELYVRQTARNNHS